MDRLVLIQNSYRLSRRFTFGMILREWHKVCQDELLTGGTMKIFTPTNVTPAMPPERHQAWLSWQPSSLVEINRYNRHMQDAHGFVNNAVTVEQKFIYDGPEAFPLFMVTEYDSDPPGRVTYVTTTAVFPDHNLVDNECINIGGGLYWIRLDDDDGSMVSFEVNGKRPWRQLCGSFVWV